MLDSLKAAASKAVSNVKSAVSSAIDSVTGSSDTKKTEKTSSKKSSKVGNELNGSTKSQKAKEANKSTASKLYSDITAKTKYGMPTTGDNIGSHIKEITPNNVYKVLKDYKKQSGGESLITSICSEVGLSADERAEYLTHIKNQIVKCAKNAGTNVDDISKELDNQIKHEKNKIGPMSGDNIIVNIDRIATRMKQSNHGNYKANGKIDKDFKQGRSGDCWLLAGIKSITENPEALKQLNKQISVDDKGNVTVELKGAGKTYTISRKELLGATELASGDLDVRAIEIAMNKYRTETKGKNIKGGKSDELWDALFENNKGDHGWRIPYLSSLSSDSLTTVSTLAPWARNAVAYDEKGKEVKLVDNHVYTVKDITADKVKLINPWDSSKTLTMSRASYEFAFMFSMSSNRGMA